MSQLTSMLNILPESAGPISISLYESISTHARVLIWLVLGDAIEIVVSPVTVLPVSEAKPPWLPFSKTT